MLNNVIKRLNHRIVKTRLPSSDKVVSFRPMQGKEEKLLLIAKESRESDEIMSTVAQVVQNCLVDDVDVSKLPVFDVEWLFVQIRIESVSPIAPVSYLDSEDRRRYDVDVDLRSVTVVKPPAERDVEIAEGVTLRLRWPTVRDYVDSSTIPSDADAAHFLATRCVDKIFDGDTVIEADDQPEGEVDELVASLDSLSYKSVMDWVSSTPHLLATIRYVNSKGREREVVLQNLTDFFRFR